MNCDRIICIKESICHFTQYLAGGHSNDIASPTSNTPSLVSLDMDPHRRSCLRPPWYSTCAVTTLRLSSTGQTPDDMATAPICVTGKPKQLKQSQNVFIDDRGFPNETEHYKALLRNVDGSPILRKLKHSPPPLDEVDPQFFCAYDKAKHSKQHQKCKTRW